MSGGHFDYKQYAIESTAEEVARLIGGNNYEWDYKPGDQREDERDHDFKRFDDDIIEKFKEGYRKIKEAYIYTQRIDWLVSGDDGEQSFRNRLKGDLEELEEELLDIDFEKLFLEKFLND